MKTIYFIILLSILFCLKGYSQTQLPLDIRVEKQSMSMPMSSLEDMFFESYYYFKPVNIKFDGSVLNMCFDNGSTYAKKNVTEVGRDVDYEGGMISMETFTYTDNENVSDTISLIFDHTVGYIQIVMPTKNSKGNYIGYTSFRKFTNEAKENNLALN